VAAANGAVDYFNDDVLTASLDLTMLNVVRLRGGGAADPSSDSDLASAHVPAITTLAPHGGSVAITAATSSLAVRAASVASTVTHGK
jgi:hypothetical protein